MSEMKQYMERSLDPVTGERVVCEYDGGAPIALYTARQAGDYAYTLYPRSIINIYALSKIDYRKKTVSIFKVGREDCL